MRSKASGMEKKGEFIMVWILTLTLLRHARTFVGDD